MLYTELLVIIRHTIGLLFMCPVYTMDYNINYYNYQFPKEAQKCPYRHSVWVLKQVSCMNFIQYFH